MRFIDLFCGIGGFRYGLEKCSNEKQRQGFQGIGNPERECGEQFNRSANRQFNCVWSNDNDKYACQVYRKHFGEVHEGDIRAVDADTIPEHDLLCAGFPCQSFSIAGKRRGFEDTRGTLFFEICRILRAKRPRMLFLENVKGLLSADEGRTFQTIIQSLDELGYDCQWQVLNSKDYGVPQNRERVFIIGHLRGTPRPKVFPLGEGNSDGSRTMGGESLPTILSRDYKGIGGQEMALVMHNMQPRSPDRPSLQYSSGGSGHLTREDGQTWCLDGGATNAIEMDNKIRRLTPIECERLQGFPDNWTAVGIANGKDAKKLREKLELPANSEVIVTVSDSQRYKCLGNAVTVNVIEAIGRQLIMGI